MYARKYEPQQYRRTKWLFLRRNLYGLETARRYDAVSECPFLARIRVAARSCGTSKAGNNVKVVFTTYANPTQTPRNYGQPIIFRCVFTSRDKAGLFNTTRTYQKKSVGHVKGRS